MVRSMFDNQVHALMMIGAASVIITSAASADPAGSRPINPSAMSYPVTHAYVPPAPADFEQAGWTPTRESGVIQTSMSVPAPPHETPQPMWEVDVAMPSNPQQYGEAPFAPIGYVTHEMPPGEFSTACYPGCDGCCNYVDSCDGCCPSSCWPDGSLGEPWRMIDMFPGYLDCQGRTQHCVDVGGWTSFGYHSQSNGLFNDRPDKLNLHQSWLYLEREANPNKGLDWGFRADILYGIDAANTQSFGNNPGSFDFQNGWDRGAGYGWAMPQLYAEVVMEQFSVKVGHFFTLLGYEAVAAPDNFFYSHSFTMVNSEAFTHTGVLTKLDATDQLTIYAGYTFGWDTGFDRYTQNGEKGSSFLGGYALNVGEYVTLSHIITAGDLGLSGDGWSQSVVAEFELTDYLDYVFQTDVFDAETVETIGINQYLLYSVNEQLGVGFRGEWWKRDGGSIGAITAGLNYRPSANVVLRPEVRYQWDPNNDNGILAADSINRAIFGIDCIVTY